MWRAFVYGIGKATDNGMEDLARQSFDTFMPLDGDFDDNVVLQIKASEANACSKAVGLCE